MKINNKNQKGFSLIELIIVIAIMVGLVAVMAPQFTKYVNKSRDAAITQAGEELFAFTKAEYAEGHLTGYGKIKIFSNASSCMDVEFVDNTLDYSNGTNTGVDGFKAEANFTEKQIRQTDVAFIIEIDSTDPDMPIFKSEVLNADS